MAKKRYILIALVAALVLAIIILSRKTVFSDSTVKKADVKETYYISYQVQDGDTLWGIAERECEAFKVSTKDYVKSLKEINCLDTNRINTGSKLIIVCYR